MTRRSTRVSRGSKLAKTTAAQASAFDFILNGISSVVIVLPGLVNAFATVVNALGTVVPVFTSVAGAPGSVVKAFALNGG